MSKLSGALGALQGLEKGMVGREQAKGQLAQTLMELKKYNEITLPESQQQVAESKERSRMYAAQTESEIPRRQNLLVDLELNTMKRDQAKKQIDVYKKYAEKYGIDLSLEPLLKDAIATMQEAEERILKAQGEIRTETKSQELGVPEAKATESLETSRQRTAEAITGTKTEEAFQQPTASGGLTGPQLRGRALQVKAETDIVLGPVSVDKAIEELTQSQITTRERTAEEPYNIASYPLTQRLLQNRVAKSNLDWDVAQKYDMNQAQANLDSTQTNIAMTKREIQRIDAEMKDKAVLDGIAANSGLTNSITNKPVTTWDEYKLVMNFKMDEHLAMVRAKSTGDEYPQMTQAIKQITTAQDATFMSKAIPHKSGNMVNNFISYIPFFLSAGQDPYAAWELSKMSYVDLVEMSGRDLAGYLSADMVVNDEQIQRVMASIQQALANQSRTSTAGGTPTPAPGTTPKVYGPPAPSGVRERVAGAPGSITESQNFGLDINTTRQIASIMDDYWGLPEMENELVNFIEKERDAGKREKMTSFAEWYDEQKRQR